MSSSFDVRMLDITVACLSPIYPMHNLSVISGVWGMKYNGQKEVVLRKENEHENLCKETYSRA